MPTVPSIPPWPQPDPAPRRRLPKHVAPLVTAGMTLPLLYTTSRVALGFLSLTFPPAGILVAGGVIGVIIGVPGVTQTVVAVTGYKAEQARIEEEYQNAMAAWKARQKPVQYEFATEIEDLDRIRLAARRGDFPPLSEIRIEGPLAEKVKKSYDDMADIFAKEQTRRVEIAQSVLEAAAVMIVMGHVKAPIDAAMALTMIGRGEIPREFLREFAKMFGRTFNVFAEKGPDELKMIAQGEKLTKGNITLSKAKIAYEAAIDKYFNNLAAPFVWEFKRNGVKLIRPYKDGIILRWGDRTDADWRLMFNLPLEADVRAPREHMATVMRSPA